MNSSKIIHTSLSSIFSISDNLSSNSLQTKSTTQNPIQSQSSFTSQIDCYLMRHAQSKYNQVMNSSPYFNLSQQAKNSYQMDQSLMDCQITLKGKIEIQNIQFPMDIKIENYIHFDIIFVSPLNRTLETAKQFINYHEIRYEKIIVIQELTQVLSKICDFGEGMEKKIQKYGHMFDFYGGDLGIMGKISCSLQTVEQENKDINDTNCNINLNNSKITSGKITSSIKTYTPKQEPANRMANVMYKSQTKYSQLPYNHHKIAQNVVYQLIKKQKIQANPQRLKEYQQQVIIGYQKISQQKAINKNQINLTL